MPNATAHPTPPDAIGSQFPDRVDLGRESEVMGGASLSSDSKEPSISYPSLYLNDVGSGCDCDVGDEGWALVRYKVCGVSERDYGKEGSERNVTLDICEIRFQGESDEGDAEDDDMPDDRKLTRSLKRGMEKASSMKSQDY